MRSPAEYYLKYLVSDPDADLATVLEDVGFLGIETSLDYLTYLRKKLKFPVNYAPLDTSHEATEKFLREEKIWGLWHPDMPVREAIKLYETPSYRSTVCTALLAGFVPRAIKSLLMDVHAVDIMEESVSEFKHYFWNTDLLTRDELTLYLSSGKKEERFSYKPTLLSALRAPKNHRAGAHLTMYKMGFLPKNLDKLEVLKNSRDLLYLNLLDSDTMYQGRSKSESMRNYATTMLSLINKIEDIEQASEDVLRDFSTFVRLKRSEEEHPSVNDVLNGTPPMLAEIIDVEVEENDGQAN